MKTDRELLELAAKAAGYSSPHLDSSGEVYLVAIPPRVDFPTEWNPLTDDGDALRLAVKLGICVVFMEDNDSVGAEHSRHGVIIIEAMDDFGTRRAIVRAAAAIGETMQ